MDIILSNRARQDLKEIYEYISRDSIKYAIETTRNIRLVIRNLNNLPYIGRYIPDLESKEYRELLYKSYRIVYSISEETNTVYIHFVIHGKRDFRSIFSQYIKK